MPTPVAFELQPLLEGELLTLRPLRPDDFDALFAVAADPLIWEQHPVHDRHTEPRFREFFQGALDSRGAFVVLDRRDGRMIGSSRYHGWDAERSEVEIGWTFLARRYWGGTYNGEMKRLMLDHAFRFVERFRPRSMMEVFLIGILVAGVKLADLADIVPGIALYAFGLLIPILAAASNFLDAELVWRRIAGER